VSGQRLPQPGDTVMVDVPDGFRVGVVTRAYTGPDGVPYVEIDTDEHVDGLKLMTAAAADRVRPA
jgi:hypothetical protein